jgi:hypothetical protein
MSGNSAPPIAGASVTVQGRHLADATYGRQTRDMKRARGEQGTLFGASPTRPDVRNIAVDLGTIRWTDPKTGRRVTFTTPIVVRDALLGLARGDAPDPFRFILGRAPRTARSVRPADPLAPD